MAKSNHLLILLTLLFSASSAFAKKSDCDIPVIEKEMPAVKLPWENAAQLCQANFGKIWKDGIPEPGPGWDQKEGAYAEKVQDFLRSFDYKKPVDDGGYGWLHDARWRLTGDWAGCPSGPAASWTNEVHPAVRIYYSPEVMDWLCTNRFPGKEVENPPPLPDGAMIIKEMHQAANLAYRPNTETEKALGKAWVNANYDNDPAAMSWTIMVKGQHSYDGWFWGFYDNYPATPTGCHKTPPSYNPPVSTVSALTTAYDPETGYPLETDKCGIPKPQSEQHPPPHGPWYPTFWEFSIPDIAFPNAEFGNYCIYCHGSAESQSTFSSLRNLLGEEIQYEYLKEIPPGPSPSNAKTALNEHERKSQTLEDDLLAESQSDTTSTNPRDPFPAYNPLNKDAFEKVYPQFAGLTYDEVWQHRLPAQTWDHNPSGADGPDQFLTSDQCLSCHDAGGAGQRLPNMVVVKNDKDRTQVNLTEHAEWAASPMGLAGRDPVFYAMLESELNRAEKETDLEKFIPCIQNTCLHCHGNMGQRQHAIDTASSKDDLCASFEPLTDPTSGGSWTPEQRKAAGYGGSPFLLEDMAAWHGGANPQNAKYGGLGRDGISCTTCHHITDQDLGLSGKTFTGNFRVGPADVLYGPFDDVLTDPMHLSLGITPEKGNAINKSSLCGSCHAIYLPVFDNNGSYQRSSFEQTTYLEWLNSAFNQENNNFPPEDWRSCQDCHMRDEYVYVDKKGNNQVISLDETRIANIQDNTFPEAEFEQADLDLKFRDYKRHTLYGLNAFINAYFQQYPLLLGVRQLDFMDGTPVAPLLTGREEVLMIARQATANVDINNVKKSGTGISADVTITNLGGHKLPSGVGFRRAFIEFQVQDKKGNPIWASGLTSDVGLIQYGLTNKDLPSELLQPAPGTPCPENYQTHYEVITQPCQVQIYEELSKDSAGVFTTSFIHRYEEVKDNRLLPKGYRVFGEEEPTDKQPAYCKPWCAEADPVGKAAQDPDYQGDGPKGVMGQDTVTYKIQLTKAQMKKAKRITATLYSQATAPYFLNQRFNDGLAGPRKVNSQRLYFLQGHLNTDAEADDGSKYLDDYKLLINSASAKVK